MTGKIIPIRRQEQPSDTVSDSDLLAACAHRDQGALAQLYDRHHLQVWRFVARLLGSGCPEVDDLVQCTFVEVWRSAPRFQGRSQVCSWILGISHNLARRHMRAGSRRRVAMVALREVTPHAFEPEGQWQDKLLLEQLEDALQTLSPKLRATFVLCDLEGIKGVEAAQVLNTRPGTVWRRLHEARAKLRVALGGQR